MNKTCLFLCILAIYTAVYYRKHVYKIRIFSDNPIIKAIRQRRVFPLYFVPYGILQTVLQLFRRVKIKNSSSLTSFIINVESGGEILVEVYEPVPESVIKCFCGFGKKHRPSYGQANECENVLLIHGLNGSSRSTYIIGMANVFLRRGCRVFCYNARGARIPPKSNLFSHHGLTADLLATVEYILSHYSGFISLVGFSLGSNWTTKLLGEYSNARIRMGIAICCPFDFAYLSSYFRDELFKTRCVNYFMSRNYKRYLRKSMVSVGDLKKYKYIDEIDASLLSIFGKGSVAELYKESSCIGYIDKINVPFLFMNAEDDPIIPYKVIPFSKCMANKNTGVVLVKGGHLGFFTNGSETTAETVAGEFYDRLMCDVGKRVEVKN